MADSEQEFDLGFTNSLKSTSANRNSQIDNIGTIGNYVEVSALRTRLAAINGTYYTAARLNTMTKNDMVYAVRVNDDATTINARGAGA